MDAEPPPTIQLLYVATPLQRPCALAAPMASMQVSITIVGFILCINTVFVVLYIINAKRGSNLTGVENFFQKKSNKIIINKKHHQQNIIFLAQNQTKHHQQSHIWHL